MRMWESLGDDFRDAGVLNLAFGGSTLAACVWYFERLVVPCYPRSIVCYAGENDLGEGYMPEEVVESFRKLLAKIDSHFPTTPFTMLSIKPSPSRWHLADQIRDTNETMRRELQGRPRRYYIDIFSAMLGSDGRPDNSLFQEDWLHVSPDGYQVWKKLLLDRTGEIF